MRTAPFPGDCRPSSCTYLGDGLALASLSRQCRLHPGHGTRWSSVLDLLLLSNWPDLAEFRIEGRMSSLTRQLVLLEYTVIPASFGLPPVRLPYLSLSLSVRRANFFADWPLSLCDEVLI